MNLPAATGLPAGATEAGVPLGTSGRRFGRIGLGLHAIGNLPPGATPDAVAVIRAAVDAGIDLVDTAPVYGGGAGERRLGAAIRDVGRERIMISTKVGYLLRPADPARAVRRVVREGLSNGPAGRAHLRRHLRKSVRGVIRRLRPGDRAAVVAHGWRSPSGEPLGAVVDFSYDGARRSLDESLERLGVDHIDLALIHDPEWHVDEAIDGAYRALVDARSEGLVGAIGIGINHVAPAIRFAHVVELDAILIAGRYTLLDPSAGEELFPLAQRRGITIIAGGIFNSGVLADPREHPFYDYEPAGRRLVERALAIEAVCRLHGVPLRTAAAQFVAAHPAVGCVLIGPGTVRHLEEDLDSLATPVPDSLWDDLRQHGFIGPDAAGSPPGHR